jgi:uncharacterized protein (TIGR03437 family)
MRKRGYDPLAVKFQMKNRLADILFWLGAATALHAAPKLRLTTTSVGPVPIAQGENAVIKSTQQPCARNAGDGSLNLKLSSSDSWLVATLGTAGNTCDGGIGTPVQLRLQTSSLAKGTYTGFVTVSDPNALDAPQTISVTVAIGGDVPDRLAFYVPPNGIAMASFKTGNGAGANPTTQSGGHWLSVAGSGSGSFAFTMTYTVTANATGLAAGDYNGSVAILGSSLAADNRAVPVVLHVTAQPLAQPTSESVQFQIAKGAAKQNADVSLVNAGQGGQSAFTVSRAATATSSGGNWLSAASSGNYIKLTADPSTLGEGTYKATLTVNSNAVNGTTTIPVQLTVLAPGSPVVDTVVNVFTNSTEEGLSQGDLVAVYGTQFTTGDPQTASIPLPANVGGTQVLINGQAVPIKHVSAGEVILQIPYDAALGDGTLTVVRGGQKGNTVLIHIDAAAPVLLPFPMTRYVLAEASAGGFVGYQLTPGTLASYMFSPGAPAHIGDNVVLYAVGLGATSPAAGTGTAGPYVTPAAMVCFGSLDPIYPMKLCSTPQFAGLMPGYFGVYRINFVIPKNAPTGDAVRIYVRVGEMTSNILSIAIQ